MKNKSEKSYKEILDLLKKTIPEVKTIKCCKNCPAFQVVLIWPEYNTSIVCEYLYQ